MRSFGVYFVEEEVKWHLLNFPFDQDGTMKAIENIPLDVIQFVSHKLVYYIFKLTNWQLPFINFFKINHEYGESKGINESLFWQGSYF